MVEIATEKQKQAYCDLWKKCFEDSDTFIKWFFEKRFLPDFSTYIQKDSKIVCCMQAYPMHIWLRGNTIKAAMLCGVCTDPVYRRQGLMTELFSETMKILRQKGIAVAVHTPAVLNSYYRFGHFAVNRCQYIKAEQIPEVKKCHEIKQFHEFYEIKKLYECYEKFSQKYSGCISRTMADFMLKMEEHTTDNAKIIAYQKQQEIKGYAVFYQTNDSVQAVEVVAENDSIYQKLIEEICSFGKGLQLSVKLPEDVCVDFPFAQRQFLEKGVAGVLDISKFLKSVTQTTGFAIEIEDKVIPENNGVFDLDGSKTSASPDIKLNAESAVQLLFGYCSLKELEAENRVKIYHNENAKEIEKLYQKQNCYIVDEY